MKLFNATKTAYDEIIALATKHSELCDINISDIEYRRDNHLFGVELVEKYGLNVNPKEIYKKHWNSISYYKGIGFYADKVLWLGCSDDGKQPENEYLVSISFPTGAYIFGEQYDYMRDTFREMFAEFKSYLPKYIDTLNSHLLFTLDMASKPFNEFDEIVAKYRDKAKDEIRIKKAAALQKQLDALMDGDE